MRCTTTLPIGLTDEMRLRLTGPSRAEIRVAVLREIERIERILADPNAARLQVDRMHAWLNRSAPSRQACQAGAITGGR